jgi:DNA-binding HxlR family transcriptional regulator
LVLGGKWRVPIINSICNGNHRFTMIFRSVPGITRRTLSKELKELETNYIITRNIISGFPDMVEYRTTDYSKTLATIITEMVRWGIEHKVKVVSTGKNKRTR